MTNRNSSCIDTAMTYILSPLKPEQVADEDLSAYTENIVRQSGTSFYWAMRRLSEDKRQAMYAIYAFCRVVDDIADAPSDDKHGQLESKMDLLGQWRGEIERLYAERPRHPVTRALLIPVEKYGLRKEDFRAVIDGMEMDADNTVRIRDMQELELYCDRVACAVGRLSNRVFGLPEEIADPLAKALGLALQLTNILRDVHEDVGIDRLYLPTDLLIAHDIEVTDLSSLVRHSKLPGVCELIAGIAERRFQEARELIARCDPDAVRPAVMMMEVYHRVLIKMVNNQWQNPMKRVSLSSLEKIWLMLRYGVL